MYNEQIPFCDSVNMKQIEKLEKIITEVEKSKIPVVESNGQLSFLAESSKPTAIQNKLIKDATQERLTTFEQQNSYPINTSEYFIHNLKVLLDPNINSESGCEQLEIPLGIPYTELEVKPQVSYDSLKKEHERAINKLRYELKQTATREFFTYQPEIFETFTHISEKDPFTYAKSIAIWSILSSNQFSDTKKEQIEIIKKPYLQYIYDCIKENKSINLIKLGLPFDHSRNQEVSLSESISFSRIKALNKVIEKVYKPENNKPAIKMTILGDGKIAYPLGVSREEVESYQNSCNLLARELGDSVCVVDLFDFIDQNTEGGLKKYNEVYLKNIKDNDQDLPGNIVEIYLKRIDELYPDITSEERKEMAQKITQEYLAHIKTRSDLKVLTDVGKYGMYFTGLDKNQTTRPNYKMLPSSDFAPERVGTIELNNGKLIQLRYGDVPVETKTNVDNQIEKKLILGINSLVQSGEIIPVYREGQKRAWYYKLTKKI